MYKLYIYIYIYIYMLYISLYVYMLYIYVYIYIYIYTYVRSIFAHIWAVLLCSSPKSSSSRASDRVLEPLAIQYVQKMFCTSHHTCITHIYICTYIHMCTCIYVYIQFICFLIYETLYLSFDKISSSKRASDRVLMRLAMLKVQMLHTRHHMCVIHIHIHVFIFIWMFSSVHSHLWGVFFLFTKRLERARLW